MDKESIFAMARENGATRREAARFVKIVTAAVEEEREACKAEASGAAMFEVAATKGLRIEDAGQLTAYRHGWSHGAQEAADRIGKRSNSKSPTPGDG